MTLLMIFSIMYLEFAFGTVNGLEPPTFNIYADALPTELYRSEFIS